MNTIYKAIFSLLEEIKAEPRSSRKITLIQEFPHREELKKLFYLSYDPHVVFGITSKAIKNTRGGLVSDVNPDILEHITTLSGRNAKIEYFNSATAWLSPRARQYLLSALDKDLNIGIGIKTINKALENTVTDFQLMLAHKQTEERYNLAFSDTDYVFYNLKVDGVRCKVVVKSKDNIIFYSRNGLEMEDFLVENIRYEIQKHYYLFAGRQLDCEIYSDHFQKFMRIYRRKNVDMDSIYIRNSTRLAIFDVLDHAEKPLYKRIRILREIASKNFRFIKVLEYHKVPNNYQELWEISKQFIERGEEGIIVKHPNQPYEFKRSNYWLKFKNKETIDVQITGVYEGEANTQFAGALGGFIFTYKGNEVRCGSGFSEEERKRLWLIQDEIVGKWVEISYMEETKTGSLRHPVFERFRFDLER